jgi:hypothetical protein
LLEPVLHYRLPASLPWQQEQLVLAPKHKVLRQQLVVVVTVALRMAPRKQLLLCDMLGMRHQSECCNAAHMAPTAVQASH